MNRFFVKLIKSLTILFFSTNLNAQTSWSQQCNFLASARSGAVSFVTGSYAYAGLGYTGTTVTKDFLKYSPLNNTWNSIANFGGVARQNAVAFVINDTAYVGTGDSGSPNYTKYKDFWKYIPSSNTWVRIADFGGTARTGAVAFSIGNKGYVATGSDDTGELKDVWEYDPTVNTWNRKNDFGSDKRKNAVAFSINGKGYISSGWSITSYTNVLSDIQEYNPATDTWTEKVFADGSLSKKQFAGCFVLKGKAYLISGNNSNSVIVYNPVTNALSSETNFGPAGETQRNNPVAFAINGKGYAGLGYVMVSMSNLTYKYDLWVFNITLPPDVPSNLAATAIDNEHVQLNWSDNSTDETYFIIEYSKDTNAQFKKLDSVGTNSITYTTKGLTDSSQYFFRVRAKNSAGYSSYSNEVSSKTFAWHVPKAPTNLNATVDKNDYFNLSWTDNATNDSLTSIEISLADSLHFKKVIDVTYSPMCGFSTSVNDSSTYFIRIRSKNRVGYSAYSNIVGVVTYAREARGLSAVSVSSKEIDVMWRDYSSVESGFIIERSVNDSLHFIKIDSIGTNIGYYYYKLTYRDYKVTEGTTYYYRLSTIINKRKIYCKNIDKATPTETGSWIKFTDYPGIRAEDGIGYYYNGYVYMGLGGYDGNQFWAFDTQAKTWSKKADLGGKTWSYASTFLINNKGYACMGSVNMNERKQVWEYDFVNDKWTQKANVPFTDRYNQISFSLGDNGYILGGINSSTHSESKELWEYNSLNDSWTQLADFPGGACSSLPVFTYNGNIYVLYKKTELWEFSLPGKVWNKIRTLKQPMVGYPGYSLDEKFITFSYNYECELITLWEYDFLKDTVVKKSYFPGSATREMVFTKRDREIYVGGGAGNGYTSEFWVYRPFVPATPTKLVASPVAINKVSLNWTDISTKETKYYIERRNFNNNNFSIVDSVDYNITSYTDTTVAKATWYYYRVRAKNNEGYSDYSNLAFAMTQVPSKPDISYIDTKLDANWARIFTRGYTTLGIKGYIVERSVDGGNTFTAIDTFAARYYSDVDSNLIVGNEYTYRIKAYNELGNSEASSPKKVIPGSYYHNSIPNVKIKEAIYFDPYGYDADYDHCYTGKQKFYPDGTGSKLTINFDEFSLYQNDTLTIYNGSDTNSPIIGKYTSTNKPNNLICAKNEEGSLTVVFVAPCGTYSYGYYGWKARIKSTGIFPPTGLKVRMESRKLNLLDWTDNSENESKFVIERSVSDSLHFTILDSVAANMITYKDTSIIAGTRYYYRVTAVKDTKYSDYTNQVSVRFSGVGINEVKEDSELIVFPNPATSNFQIRIKSVIHQTVIIDISNVLGQSVKKLRKNIDCEHTDLSFDTTGFSNGLYYVQIKTKSGTITKTVLIQK